MTHRPLKVPVQNKNQFHIFLFPLILVYSGLENVCALVVAMQQAKYKQDKRNKVTAYCSKCDLHYPDRSFASHIPLCNAASDTNYPRMQRHIGKLALGKNGQPVSTCSTN